MNTYMLARGQMALGLLLLIVGGELLVRGTLALGNVVGSNIVKVSSYHSLSLHC